MSKLLLSLPEAKAALSKVLCVLRQNSDVFCMIAHDVKVLALGRKNPGSAGQLRQNSIHYYQTLDHVKRAVCYFFY